MKNYAMSGAILTVSIFLLKLLADLPNGIRQIQSLSDFMAGTGLLLVFLACFAAFGALIGVIVGYFLERERRQAKDAPQTMKKLPE